MPVNGFVLLWAAGLRMSKRIGGVVWFALLLTCQPSRHAPLAQDLRVARAAGGG